MIERAFRGATYRDDLVEAGAGKAVAAKQRGRRPHDRAAMLWRCRHGSHSLSGLQMVRGSITWSGVQKGRAMTSDIPEGFERHFRHSPLTDPWEPIYSKRTAEAVIFGLRLATPHTNSRGLAHGGLITALADNAMGLSCALKLGGGARLVTVSLSIDFIGPAQVGQWLAGGNAIIKIGG